MFNEFCEFFGLKDKYFCTVRKTPFEEFIERFEGYTFNKGVYRIHKKEDMIKWTKLMYEYFPQCETEVIVFAYDWMGRQYGVDKHNFDEIIIFDPGYGDGLSALISFSEFHNYHIPSNPEEMILYNSFCEWFRKKQIELKREECVGFKVPLFLGGKDILGNLEVIDMEVYWGIQSQFF